MGYEGSLQTSQAVALETRLASRLVHPAIEGVATAVPAHRVSQAEIRRRAETVLGGLDPTLLKYLTVFDNSGIEWRNFSMPLDWYLQPHGWADRNRAFLDVGLNLMESAVSRTLADTGTSPSEIDGIVFVTSTGLATPSLDARLVNRLGLRPDVVRLPVWGLGCAGGVAGLARAADLARARPDGRFLLVSLELCSLAFMRGSLEKKMVVASTLFADGCACALVSGPQAAPSTAPRVVASASHQWPRTEWIMGWDVLDEGLGVVISREIPQFVQDQSAPVIREFLARHSGRDPRYLLHPGGAKVIQAYEAALGLDAWALQDTAAVLREYGNMSSPTVLFVLERALRQGLRDGRDALLGALGPGFASELALLRPGS